MRIIFSCEIETFTEENNPINVSGNFDVAFYFLGNNLDKLTTTNDDQGLTINGDLITALANISYSTSRGIIYTRCQGTILKNFMLPILPNEELQALLYWDILNKPS